MTIKIFFRKCKSLYYNLHLVKEIPMLFTVTFFKKVTVIDKPMQNLRQKESTISQVGLILSTDHFDHDGHFCLA